MIRAGGVLNVAMSLTVCIQLFVGVGGYLKYGDTVKESITLNLPIQKG